DAERLRRELDQLAQLRLPATDLPSHALVLGHVHHRAEVAFDDAVFANGGSNAPQEEYLAVVSDDAEDMIGIPGFRAHPRDDPFDVLTIVRMHVREHVRQGDLSVAR